MILMTAQAVMSLESSGGAISTMSMSFTGSLSMIKRTNSISSLEVSPPETGVPTAGAKAGSRTAISRVK